MLIFKKENLNQVVDLLKEGKVLIFPTETSYGLGCDATNQEAVDKIFKIKNRAKNKPLLVLVSSVAQAKKYLIWNETLDNLSQKYWPGPLTIVGECHKSLAMGVLSSDGTIAVRVSDHPLANMLCKKIGEPLVATSANISGQSEIYSAEEIKEEFSDCVNCPDAFLDLGDLPLHPPTTIVSVLDDELKILRQGEIIIE